ncbi:rRNA adenine N-6-methyltransferase family protein [Alphaproteobacteria bacterium]|nr:rRNA adenine N-6-methyltransferase family protein [Alphaproteobacteria bacterium]
MKLNKIKFYLYQLIYSQIKHTKVMTQNMKSPGNGFLGNVARELMIIFNEFVYNDSIKKLNIKKNDKVIEIGSGNGQGIEKLLDLSTKKIVSIEVSDSFRSKLIQRFKNQNVTILSNDAKNLSDVVKSNTFDKLLAVNVIYFLNPIKEYAEEFFRILNVNGLGLLVCKFEGIKNFDNKVAPNKNLHDIVKTFENVGFSVQTEFIDSKDLQKGYHAIYLRKKYKSE